MVNLRGGHDDGLLKSVENKLYHTFDRSYRYDHAGRLEEAFSGAQAISLVKPVPSNTVPYWQKYEYDAWGNTKRPRSTRGTGVTLRTARWTTTTLRASPGLKGRGFPTTAGRILN